jgi:predicted HTH transcriptional regulator
MNDAQLSALLVELLAPQNETEWVEFKHNNDNPEMIGEYLSALANSAALHGREMGYLVWGVEDGTKAIVGTTFKPREARKGNEELENWLMRSLHPQVNFKIYEWQHEARPMVLFEILRATHAPVRFQTEEFIRVGSLKKKLREYPAKEKELWASFDRTPFERGIAKVDLVAADVLSLIDFVTCFDLLGVPLPGDQNATLARLADERLVVAKPGSRFDVTNLGAILFAKDLRSFDRLSRKALRIIKYKGTGRTQTEREWRDEPSHKGYAVGFKAAVAYIDSLLPHSEPIGQAFRTEVRLYPEQAIRELVANCLIHQDFAATGAGPMVEIFDGRLEITNPGEPLIDPQRFIDTPPQARNEALAALMRRMRIGEEAGSGIDKVITAVEADHLPAPHFTAPTGFTRVFLYGPRKLVDMDKHERIRACYQHACLRFVQGSRMTNPSLRERLGIEKGNASQVSRLIREALAAGVIRLYAADVRDRDRSYVPFWA